MKKITLLMLGMLMITSAGAEETEYVPLVREGVVWEYVEFHNMIGLNPASDEMQLYTLEFNGTTDITDETGQSKTYYNLYRTDFGKGYSAQEPYLAALVREEDMKVMTSSFGTIYDFNKPMFLPENAILYYDEEGAPVYPMPYNIDNIEEINVEIAGTTRKGYQINTGLSDVKFYLGDFKTIEGIGVDCMFGDLLQPFREFVTGAPALREVDYGEYLAGLSAVYENGDLVYKGCLYDISQQLKNPQSITIVPGDKLVSSVCYYDLAGLESTEPREGVSIKVTTYTDGTRKCEKVVR